MSALGAASVNSHDSQWTANKTNKSVQWNVAGDQLDLQYSALTIQGLEDADGC